MMTSALLGSEKIRKQQ